MPDERSVSSRSVKVTLGSNLQSKGWLGMSETLTPNNSSVFHPIKLKFGTFVEPIHTNMSAQSGMRSME